MSTWTPERVRDDVLNVLMGEVGYVSGNYQRSRYGEAKNWRSNWLWGAEWQGYWCNRFLSWGVDKVCGAKAGVAAIGRQAGTALPVGFAATWLQREWFRTNNRHSGWANAQRGDFVLFKLDGPRSVNPTNHVGMFIRWADGGPNGRAVVLEGNLPHPQGRGGIGVHYHARPLDHQIVAVYRPDWAAAARVLNAAAKPTPAPPPKPTPAPKPEPDPKPEPSTPEVPDMSAHEIAGSDRYGTAVAISQEFWERDEITTVYLAAGNGIDATVGGASVDGPILLVRDPLPAVVAAEIKRLAPSDVKRLGSSAAVPDSVLHAARKAAGLKD